ncbi:uncharacterized protein MELLADRAFT_84108 [Melampsora larici-populina 98AG31]|uniref:Uncharacterized protein n=1 Tax=Melampsora larici-populina (strain 98AG31 / pathotype 3-4-7) TaxID=747676 RepID=F4SBI9_MELLP|nr:uncharacterized protein MELLADRAFT_84108 [Melampsora larici-populina 98AG31]EGF97987.1 hypothetical protein MELLADRAFT_84108 [Melampsora larici-populina 98AG31]
MNSSKLKSNAWQDSSEPNPTFLALNEGFQIPFVAKKLTRDQNSLDNPNHLSFHLSPGVYKAT